MQRRGFLGLLLALIMAMGWMADDAAARQVGAMARRPRPGAVSGILDGFTAREIRGLRFLVDGKPRRIRVSGSTFTVPGLPPGEHEISIIDKILGGGVNFTLKITSGVTVDLGKIFLASGGRIEGSVFHVIDPVTGDSEPLAGVEVVAEPDFPVPLLGKARAAGFPKKLFAITDKDGFYAMDEVPVGPYRVSVVVPGLEAGVSFTFVGLGDISSIDFELRDVIEEGVATVTGVINAPDGSPAEGALVSILPQDVYFPFKVSPKSVAAAIRAGKGAGARPTVLPRLEFSTLTDQNGRYTLNVPSGYSSIAVYLDGTGGYFDTLALRPRETLVVSVNLEEAADIAPGSVNGFVTDAATKRPILGAQVTALLYFIQGGPDGGSFIIPPPKPLLAFTNKKGFYQIDGLPAGLIQFQVDAKGYQSEIREVEVPESGTATLSFALSRKKLR